MAALSSKLTVVFSLALASAAVLLPAHCFDFEVGDGAGWAVPQPNDTQFYNQWASANRFQVGDSINFRYKKDSVMVVTEEEYKQCSSSHPIFFSNNGRTEFRPDRSGTFYFISGVRGHCDRGERMIIRVMAHPDDPGVPSPTNHTGTDTPASRSSATLAAAAHRILLFMLASLCAYNNLV